MVQLQVQTLLDAQVCVHLCARQDASHALASLSLCMIADVLDAMPRTIQWPVVHAISPCDGCDHPIAHRMWNYMQHDAMVTRYDTVHLTEYMTDVRITQCTSYYLLAIRYERMAGQWALAICHLAMCTQVTAHCDSCLLYTMVRINNSEISGKSDSEILVHTIVHMMGRILRCFDVRASPIR